MAVDLTGVSPATGGGSDAAQTDQASEIANDSSVPGDTVADALDNIVAGSGGVTAKEVDFTYLTESPLWVRSVPANTLVDRVQLLIDTPFDGTVTLTVGEIGTPDRLMAAVENDPAQAGSYETAPAHTYAGATDVQLYLSIGGATQGAGRVVLYSGGA